MPDSVPSVTQIDPQIPPWIYARDTIKNLIFYLEKHKYNKQSLKSS